MKLSVYLSTKEIMLIVQNISYIHLDKTSLFNNLNFTLPTHSKTALIGQNGSGKSTLLKLIAGLYPVTTGQIHTVENPYYIPQHFGQYNTLTVAEALGIADKLHAFECILSGEMTEAYLELLDDDWTIEERCQESLQHWQLEGISLSSPMALLSGGQKTKVFLAGIEIHKPNFILLDEPSNHLDLAGRELLYDFILTTSATLFVVSHDRTLLNLLNNIYELTPTGITTYGGNYDFYCEQKEIAVNALQHRIESQEKELRKAKQKERETMERQQKLDARAKKNVGKAGLPKIVANTWRNSAERSTAKIAGVHLEKTTNISQELRALRTQQTELDKMKFAFDTSNLHFGKTLFQGEDLNYMHNTKCLWTPDLNFSIKSGERTAIQGKNGSGKTTFIRLLLGELLPARGKLYRATEQIVYIDQEYSLINDQLNIYEQAQTFNQTALQEHEVKIRLNRFLFDKDEWDKPCHALSGGERMRLALCCLNIGQIAPDMIILDEPTNNLDIQNIDILTSAIRDYTGTLLVASHDNIFLEEIGIQRHINF
ncbi:ABC-F family ATP-binding cassette domain-containing protein [Sphingobacterium wenxiniae]|uniref:ATPase components of ABC transporters with duplicated ATPase domains n=1 Tax=Sphingobacterium wenxiniae TaxID=683125 RepID=A0A1I6VT33_9SPHI|nr:ABC-F family ATP-binding cassette domain-containing protein [Sphingobacterium wenxiniae]SFT16892.1 ATPase components of ABC transporters with duplicated ATPase domains [Sphingobacterium wenxiniae]